MAVYKSNVGQKFSMDVSSGGGSWKRVRWEFHKGQRFMVRAMCGVQLKDRKRAKDLMLKP